MAKIVKQVWLLREKNEMFTYVDDSPAGNNEECLAGPVSVEFDVPDVARCPHCHKALPEAEKPKLPLLPLVVGGMYRTRGGDKVKLVCRNDANYFPWEGDNYSTYLDSGQEYGTEKNLNDLIERIA